MASVFLVRPAAVLAAAPRLSSLPPAALVTTAAAAAAAAAMLILLAAVTSRRREGLAGGEDSEREEDAVDFWTGLEESVLRRNVPLELLDSTPRRTEPEFIWRESGPFQPPIPRGLKIVGRFWQKLRLHGSDHQIVLYSAFYDDRLAEAEVRTEGRWWDAEVGAEVKVLAGLRFVNVYYRLFCLLWFEDLPQPLVVPVWRFQMLRTPETYGHERDRMPEELYWGPDYFYAHFLVCQVPSSYHQRGLFPLVVTLTEDPRANASNALRVQYAKRENPTIKKKDFAVCVKGVRAITSDRTDALMEWIELVRMMGADKIFVYTYSNLRRAKRILQHYHDAGLVDITPFSIAGDYPSDRLIEHKALSLVRHLACLMEWFTYHDCFYRNMYKYEWLTLLDLDELIVPMERRNWKELLEQALEWQRKEDKSSNATDKNAADSFAAVSFRHVFFYTGVKVVRSAGGKGKRCNLLLENENGGRPKLPMTSITKRHKYHYNPAHQSKLFFNTSQVEVVFNHWVANCLGNGYSEEEKAKIDVEQKCRSLFSPVDIGQLNHYREKVWYYEEQIAHCLQTWKDPKNMVSDNSLSRFRNEVQLRMREAKARIRSEDKQRIAKI